MTEPRGGRRDLVARLRTYFLAGVLVTAPIGVTVAIAWWFVDFVDRKVVPLIRDALGVEYNFPGIGLVVLLTAITLIGALTAGLLGRWLVAIGESIVKRMPIVRSVYSGTKQILETLLRDQSKAFRKAVLIQYPRKGLWAIAFVTSSTEGELGRRLGEGYINVFLPTTPNPTSGFLLVVPRADVVELDMSVEQAVRMVISAGMASPTDELVGAERILAGRMGKAQIEERLYGHRSEHEKTEKD